MRRRIALKTFSAALAGTGLFASRSDSVAASTAVLPAPFVETRDRTQLFYRDWGAGKPIVFIHGWALHSAMWQYQMLPLAEQGLRCLAYDQRGHGRSGDPGRGYDFDTLADDLAVMLERLNLRNVTLVGHSMGGGVVVRYLTRFGASRIVRIVMLAPTTPFILKTADNPDGVDKRIFEQLRVVMSKDFPKWLSENVRPFFTPDTSPETMQWGINMCLQASLKAALDCNRAITETDFRAELRKLTVPTLILHGDADASAPLALTGRKTAQLISGSKLKVYEGAPHGLFITHQERVNQDLLDFIKS